MRGALAAGLLCLCLRAGLRVAVWESLAHWAYTHALLVRSVRVVLIRVPAAAAAAALASCAKTSTCSAGVAPSGCTLSTVALASCCCSGSSCCIAPLHLVCTIRMRSQSIPLVSKGATKLQLGAVAEVKRQDTCCQCHYVCVTRTFAIQQCKCLEYVTELLSFRIGKRSALRWLSKCKLI